MKLKELRAQFALVCCMLLNDDSLV